MACVGAHLHERKDEKREREEREERAGLVLVCRLLACFYALCSGGTASVARPDVVHVRLASGGRDGREGWERESANKPNKKRE